MNISSPAASTAAPTYAQALRARQDAQAAKADEKRAVAENVFEAMSSRRMDAPQRAKQQAKAKLIEIVKRLQILKKLFAGDPKEMARALKAIFKELRAAVKAYKDAGGEEFAMTGEAARSAVANDAAPSAQAASDDADTADAEEADTPAPVEDAAPVEAEVQETPPQEAPPQQTAQQGSAIYDAVAGKMRKAIGEDGLDFIKMVRSVIKAVVDVLEGSRIQDKGRKRDKDTDKAFEEAGKELRDLNKDLEDMARDIRRAAPDAGMKLSMDA